MPPAMSAFDARAGWINPEPCECTQITAEWNLVKSDAAGSPSWLWAVLNPDTQLYEARWACINEALTHRRCWRRAMAASRSGFPSRRRRTPNAERRRSVCG